MNFEEDSPRRKDQIATRARMLPACSSSCKAISAKYHSARRDSNGIEASRAFRKP